MAENVFAGMSIAIAAIAQAGKLADTEWRHIVDKNTAKNL